MADIISAKFSEWTRGLGPIESRISVFEHVRDIPYAIIAELRDPVTGPSKMLEINKGSCVPKHLFLAKAFGSLGIPVKYTSYLFNWDDPAIGYPAELRVLAGRMPVSAHLALKININGRWVLVDATWDRPLAKCGFPVNMTWDGMSDTVNAVTPISEVIHSDLEDRIRYASRIRSGYAKEDIAIYDEFSAKLNEWLAVARKPGG